MRLLFALATVAACGSTPPVTSLSNTPPVTPLSNTVNDRPDAGDSPSQAKTPENRYKAQTWIDKLDDPRESERAVTELEQLGDPSAIAPLGEAWTAQGKPVRILQVIISLAHPLTPELR